MKGRREFVRARADGACEYCRLPEVLSGASFHIEHIVPSSRGGVDEESNLALSCPRCNMHKGDRIHADDPRTGRRARLFNPRKDPWSVHFRWSRDRRKIVGRTAVGRATVRALDFNSKMRQRLRAIWRDRLRDMFPFE